MKNIVFNALCIIHIAIWIFVMFAFVNKTYAIINLHYVIPVIYILHMLPFHILNSLKSSIDNNDFEKHVDNINKCLIFPKIFTDFQKKFNSLSFCNPISPQGMLILGAITSVYSVRYS